jgi:hypothetical protein
MHIEEQDQAVTSTEIPPQVDSRLVKKQHRGKRVGASRKPNLITGGRGDCSKSLARHVFRGAS